MEKDKNFDPQPIGVGYFGNVYDQFRGKVKEAFDFLITHKSGDLLGVFCDEEIGDIDLVWGSEEDKKGLEHIIAKHVGEGKDFSSLDEARSIIEMVIYKGKKIRSNGQKGGWIACEKCLMDKKEDKNGCNAHDKPLSGMLLSPNNSLMDISGGGAWAMIKRCVGPPSS